MAARVKTPHTVITFPTTAAAMAFEAAARELGIAGRTIPVPSAVHAGCGTCWSCAPDQAESVLAAAREHGLAIEGTYTVDLY